CRFVQSFHAPGTYRSLRHHPTHFAGSSRRADETKVPPTVFAPMRPSTRAERPNQGADRRRGCHQTAESQGRKSLHLCRTGVLRVRWFDPIPEASELPDQCCSAPLLGSFGGGWTSFFVTDSRVQDQPNQPTVSMGNRPDSLFVSQTGYCTSIN